MCVYLVSRLAYQDCVLFCYAFVSVQMTSTKAAADDVIQMVFYVHHDASNVVSAVKVTRIYSRLEPIELAAYIGAQV